MSKQQKIEEKKKTYANPILYLRKSKKGEHLYAFNVSVKDAEGLDTNEMVLGGSVESLIMNVSDVEKLLNGSAEWIKVSVLVAEEVD